MGLLGWWMHVKRLLSQKNNDLVGVFNGFGGFEWLTLDFFMGYYYMIDFGYFHGICIYMVDWNVYLVGGMFLPL